MLKGLYSITLLKTAFEDFTSELIEENELLSGQWTTSTIDNEGAKLQACQLCDLHLKKDLISTQESLDIMIPFQDQRWLRHDWNMLHKLMCIIMQSQKLRFGAYMEDIKFKLNSGFMDGKILFKIIWKCWILRDFGILWTLFFS